MKRIIGILGCMVMMFSFCACGGSIETVKTKDMPSEIYSQQDISEAIETIKDEFDKEWKGCTLNELYYAGDAVSQEYRDWADRNNADEVIVLLSSFFVDESCEDGSLNQNSTYDDWNWILVRTEKGKWQHVDHGY